MLKSTMLKSTMLKSTTLKTLRLKRKDSFLLSPSCRAGCAERLAGNYAVPDLGIFGSVYDLLV